MENVKACCEALRSGKMDEALGRVYVTGDAVAAQRERYAKAAEEFGKLFGEDREVILFTAPGRTEVCGNHTDHNHGRVLAAGVNLDVIAVVSKNDEGIVRVKSEGYDMDTVDLSCLEPQESEFGRSQGLVRGVCARFKQLGYEIGGYDAYTTSNVLKGSGLSSSAAFEVLIGTVLSHLYNGGSADAVTIAKVAQYAENVFFNKPCGLMDQMASSVGGFVEIDFKDPENPVIEKVDFDFASCGHSLCIVDTGGNHADLTEDYAAVRREMEAAAEVMGKKVLRDVGRDEFMRRIPEIREKVNDRAVLRGIHFFADNERVLKEAQALRSGNFEEFKRLVTESGHSSYMYNQNVFTPKNVAEQGVSLALAVTDVLLAGRGAFRVHGGGFAGTMQAFVPNDMLEEYKSEIEKIFGEGHCYVLSIRPVGGAMIG